MKVFYDICKVVRNEATEGFVQLAVWQNVSSNSAGNFVQICTLLPCRNIFEPRTTVSRRNVTTGKKLGKLLKNISQSVPFKPNFTKIAAMIKSSRNSIEDYRYYMEQAGLIMQLRSMGKGIGQLGKVDKVYIDNTNLIFTLAEERPQVGNIRETVFFNQMRVKNKVYRSEKADFNIHDYTFEVAGKSKNQAQIKDLKNAFIVKDDIEYGYQNMIPLWAFGLNY